MTTRDRCAVCGNAAELWLGGSVPLCRNCYGQGHVAPPSPEHRLWTFADAADEQQARADPPPRGRYHWTSSHTRIHVHISEGDIDETRSYAVGTLDRAMACDHCGQPISGEQAFRYGVAGWRICCTRCVEFHLEDGCELLATNDRRDVPPSERWRRSRLHPRGRTLPERNFQQQHTNGYVEPEPSPTPPPSPQAEPEPDAEPASDPNAEVSFERLHALEERIVAERDREAAAVTTVEAARERLLAAHRELTEAISDYRSSASDLGRARLDGFNLALEAYACARDLGQQQWHAFQEQFRAHHQRHDQLHADHEQLHADYDQQADELERTRQQLRHAHVELELLRRHATGAVQRTLAAARALPTHVESRDLGRCPWCGSALAIKTNSYTFEQFVGCTAYPDCRYGAKLPTSTDDDNERPW